MLGTHPWLANWLLSYHCMHLFAAYIFSKTSFLWGGESLLPAILLVGAGSLSNFISKVKELDDFTFAAV